MQFIYLFALCIILFLLQAMENDFVHLFGLVVGLWMSHCGEPRLASQSAEVIDHLTYVKLSTVIDDHYPRDSKMGDDVFPNVHSDFGHND